MNPSTREATEYGVSLTRRCEARAKTWLRLSGQSLGRLNNPVEGTL
jgi:hypothetical protein